MNSLMLASLNILLAMQGEPATVSGVIRDGDGSQIIAEAVVTLTELEISSTTSADGRYRITGVAAGPHHLVIRRLGYAPRTLHVLAPPSGTLEINVSLAPVLTPAHLPNVVVRRPVELRSSRTAISSAPADRGSGAWTGRFRGS